MASHDQPPLMTYSLVLCADNQRVHAVWDWMIRAAYHDVGLVVLRAMCGAEVHPANQLPPAAAACAGCCEALPTNAISRPAPGGLMLRELARIHTEMTQ